MMSSFHIVLAMKPISGNFAQNAVEHGVAGLNIDAGRIEAGEDHKKNCNRSAVESHWRLNASPRMPVVASPLGRFPANLILEDIEAVKKMFPESISTGGKNPIRKHKNGWKDGYFTEGVLTRGSHTGGLGDSGSAARFFKQVETE